MRPGKLTVYNAAGTRVVLTFDDVTQLVGFEQYTGKTWRDVEDQLPGTIPPGINMDEPVRFAVEMLPPGKGAPSRKARRRIEKAQRKARAAAVREVKRQKPVVDFTDPEALAGAVTLDV